MVNTGSTTLHPTCALSLAECADFFYPPPNPPCSHCQKKSPATSPAGDPLPGGSHRLVCPCDGPDGKAYVLKIDVPEHPAPTTRAQQRLRFLQEQTAVPPGPIWDWGYLQTVSTGLVLLQVGQPGYGKATLKLVGHWEPLRIP